MEDRRKSPRFQIIRPAALKIPKGGIDHLGTEMKVLAENAAVDGVLVATEQVIPVGTEVEVTIFMPNDVWTSCAGKVVRVAPGAAPDRRLWVAIECTRPFSEPFRAVATLV